MKSCRLHQPETIVSEACQTQKEKFYTFSLYVQLRLKVIGACTYICLCTGLETRRIMGQEEGSLRETEEARG